MSDASSTKLTVGECIVAASASMAGEDNELIARVQAEGLLEPYCGFLLAISLSRDEEAMQWVRGIVANMAGDG